MSDIFKSRGAVIREGRPDTSASPQHMRDVSRPQYQYRPDASSRKSTASRDIQPGASIPNAGDQHTPEQPDAPLEERVKTAKQRIDQINKKTISIQWKINATERELKQIDQTQLTDPAQQQVRNDYIDRLLQNVDVTSKQYKAHRKEYDSIRTDANNIKAYAQTRGQDAVQRKAHLQEKQADLTQQLTDLNHQHQQATEELKNLQHELGTRPPEIVGDVTITRLRETQSQVVALKEQLHQAITEHEAILTEMNKHVSDFQDERQLVELRKSARVHATSHQDDLSRSVANYTLAHVDTNLRDITNRRLALNQRHFDAERNVNKLHAQLQKSERELTLLKQKAAEIQLPGLQEIQKPDGEVQHFRDTLEGVEGKGSSYKVLAHKFQSVWNSNQVVVPTESLSFLQEIDRNLQKIDRVVDKVLNKVTKGK